MIHSPSKMTCENFQSQLAELIGSGLSLDNHPHLRQCPRCRALLDDLQTIAQAARLLLPVVEPPDQLWQQIESAILKEENSSSLQPPR
jgi:predicted anti-sigma-YlaC factor YlaD